jgi:hypothetical protein
LLNKYSADAEAATALGSIPASSVTVEKRGGRSSVEYSTYVENQIKNHLFIFDPAL